MDTETVVIIGRSEIVTPKILEIVRNIKCIKIAINQYLDFVDYIAFVDMPMSKFNGDKKALTLKCFNVDNSESYELQTSDLPIVDGKLKYCGFTHDFVLSWCVMRKVKNVILIGVADFCTDKHFDSNQKFNPSKSCVTDSINYINNLPLNIYTVNPKSKLNVRKITIEELKKWRLQKRHSH